MPTGVRAWPPHRGVAPSPPARDAEDRPTGEDVVGLALAPPPLDTTECQGDSIGRVPNEEGVALEEVASRATPPRVNTHGEFAEE